MGQPGKAAQPGTPVEIADNLGHAQASKTGIALTYQRIDAPVADQLGQNAAHHVATTNYKQPSHRMIIA